MGARAGRLSAAERVRLLHDAARLTAEDALAGCDTIEGAVRDVTDDPEIPALVVGIGAALAAALDASATVALALAEATQVCPTCADADA